MEYYEQKLVPGCYGYNNIGVICWWNSMIQTLLGCSALHKVFQNSSLRNRNGLTAEFAKFLDNPRDPDGALRVLRQFLLSLKAGGEGRNFGASQEDCNEGFLKFLDHLRSPEVDYLFKSRYNVWMVCTCGNKKKLENDTNVFIEFDNCDRIDWGDMLTQKSTTDLRCDRCGSHMTQLKRLVAIPEIVIVLFRKYSGKKQIDVPQEFRVDGVGTYKIIGTNQHYGGTGGGHYTATTLRGDGARWKCNDSTVVKIDHITADAETYMVWYHVFSPDN